MKKLTFTAEKYQQLIDFLRRNKASLPDNLKLPNFFLNESDELLELDEIYQSLIIPHSALLSLKETGMVRFVEVDGTTYIPKSELDGIAAIIKLNREFQEMLAQPI